MDQGGALMNLLAAVALRSEVIADTTVPQRRSGDEVISGNQWRAWNNLDSVVDTAIAEPELERALFRLSILWMGNRVEAGFLKLRKATNSKTVHIRYERMWWISRALATAGNSTGIAVLIRLSGALLGLQRRLIVARYLLVGWRRIARCLESVSAE